MITKRTESSKLITVIVLIPLLVLVYSTIEKKLGIFSKETISVEKTNKQLPKNIKKKKTDTETFDIVMSKLKLQQ